MPYKKFQRILLAVDNTPYTDKAIEYALSMIDEETAISLIMVIPPISPVSYGADPLLGQQPIIVPEVNEIQLEVTKNYLDELSTRFSGANEVFTFHKIGNVREEILTQATEWAADLIIIGSSGKTGFDLFISGSVSESVVRNSSCPVLVIPGKGD